MSLPIILDSSETRPVVTDLGYEVTLSEARMALGPIAFTVAGEVHTSTSLLQYFSEAIVPDAYAHPGHTQGGEVTGELAGRFVVDWIKEDGRELGTAELLAGEYSAANFTFARGEAPLTQGADPLLAHTSLLKGVARKEGREVNFTIRVQAPTDRELIGAPFDDVITTKSTSPIAFRFHTRDPIEGDTLFDGIDFVALDEDADGVYVLDPDDADDTYNALRRTLLSHDHYSFK